MRYRFDHRICGYRVYEVEVMTWLKGYRTYIWNAAGIFLTAFTEFDWASLGFPPTVAAWIGFGVMIGNLYLRTVTNTEPGKSE
jgi:hypothetical protein